MVPPKIGSHGRLPFYETCQQDSGNANINAKDKRRGESKKVWLYTQHVWTSWVSYSHLGFRRELLRLGPRMGVEKSTSRVSTTGRVAPEFTVTSIARSRLTVRGPAVMMRDVGTLDTDSATVHGPTLSDMQNRIKPLVQQQTIMTSMQSCQKFCYEQRLYLHVSRPEKLLNEGPDPLFPHK